MIAWLWDAPGPDRSACGVSGDKDRARRAAEESLRSGQAQAARVEAAVADLGLRTLTCGYRRTGDGWQAKRGPRGIIRWVPLAPGT